MKLYFGNTITITTTILIVGIICYMIVLWKKREEINYWGRHIFILFALGGIYMYRSSNKPESLMKVAKAKGILGGVMQYDKMNFIYRKIFQSLKKIDGFNEGFKEPKIEMDLIEKFAKEMN